MFALYLPSKGKCRAFFAPMKCDCIARLRGIRRLKHGVPRLPRPLWGQERSYPKVGYGRLSNKSRDFTESAFASLTMFSKPTFRSPRSMPPT